jgi:peptide-methionine (S)-S-oxide reductase
MPENLPALPANISNQNKSSEIFVRDRFSWPLLAVSSIAAPALLFAVYSAAGLSLNIPSAFAREGIAIPAPRAAITESSAQQTAIFAGGCFWGVEGVFEHVKGVSRAEAGYAGGSKAAANYDAVGSAKTGHAEAVRIVYDPDKVSYNTLMQIFFSVAHDPTQLNRQGPDSGPQYRGAIFPVTAAQNKATKSYLAQLSAKSPWGKNPVTRIESGTFFPAEPYHQDFMAKNPSHSYIRAWDAPKVANLKRLFPSNYR